LVDLTSVSEAGRIAVRQIEAVEDDVSLACLEIDVLRHAAHDTAANRRIRVGDHRAHLDPVGRDDEEDRAEAAPLSLAAHVVLPELGPFDGRVLGKRSNEIAAVAAGAFTVVLVGRDLRRPNRRLAGVDVDELTERATLTVTG